MKSLSVIIPVYNALDSLKITLQSLVNNTDNLSELILVDDCSEQETKDFIKDLTLEADLRCVLIKITLKEHSWTNAAWNKGVAQASSDYIAVLNSDITVSPHWDKYLMDTLEHSTIACPYEQRKDGLIKLDPGIEANHPGMIKGPCYMFKMRDRDELFPIPKSLTHWCGDNLLADKAAKLDGVDFNKQAVITHGITHSGRLIPREVYNQVVLRDLKAYQAISGRDMSKIIAQFG